MIDPEDIFIENVLAIILDIIASQYIADTYYCSENITNTALICPTLFIRKTCSKAVRLHREKGFVVITKI